MLCMKPRVWPISWAMTYFSDLDMRLSGSFTARTAGSACAVWMNRQLLLSLDTSLHTSTEALMISPVRGSDQEGPIAFSVAMGT